MDYQLGEYKKAGREEGEYYPARIVPPPVLLYDWQLVQVQSQKTNLPPRSQMVNEQIPTGFLAKTSFV